jgi:hypothetical protein
MKSTLDDLLHTALKSGASVEIELCDGYGYTFKIDGTYVFPPAKEGLPHEGLDYPLEYIPEDTEWLKSWLAELNETSEGDD